MDPNMIISRLKAEIDMLKSEIVVLKGECGNDGGSLADYEKDRVRISVDEYIADKSPSSKLIFNNFDKIQYAFQLLKEKSSESPSFATNSPHKTQQSELLDFDARNLTEEQIKIFSKLKQLVTHRDNEISCLFLMF
jgi:hypothetical protein